MPDYHYATHPTSRRTVVAYTLKLALFSGIVLFVSKPAYAQEQKAAPDGNSVSEIVVTAQKRTENVQKVPITINALPASELNQRQIQTVEDLITAVPGLRSDSVAGTANIAIRGVGTTFVSGAGESSVAVHIDGVYIPQIKASLLGEDDLAQVEVLRGPQGTLYGRNSTAGVINFITAAPTNTLSEQVSVRYGNYNDVRVQGDISGPISDSLKGRIYITGEHHDGYGTDFTTGQALDNLNSYGAHGTLDWTIMPWWHSELKVSGKYEASSLLPIQPFNQQSLVLGLAPPLFSTLKPDDVLSFGRYYNHEQLELINLKNDFDLQYGLSLTSITGYVRFFDRYHYDTFSAVVEPPYPVPSAQPPLIVTGPDLSNGYSQEFDLKGNSNKLKWLTGLYYFHEDQKNSNQSDFDVIGSKGIGLVPFPFYNYLNDESSSRNSVSLFVDGTYSITPKFRLFGGVRGLYESYTEKLSVVDSFGVVTPGDTPIADCDEKEKTSDTAKTGRGGAQYDITSQSMVYVQASTGYKSGGFSQTTCNNKYKPETVTSVEVGYKSRLFDNKLTFDASAYHYDYYDLGIEQSTIYGTIITSVPRSHVWGFDFSGNLRVTDQITFDANATFLDARYDYFINQDATFGVPVGTSLAGTRLNKAPASSGTIGATYLVPTRIGDIDLRAEVYLTSSYHLREFTVPGTIQGGYAQVNLYATLRMQGDKYEVRFYAKDVNDTRYIAGIAGILTGAEGTYNPPPTYGAELVAKF